MEPALSNGDMVLGSRIGGSYRGGDIVVFEFSNVYYIKRVIGGPGDIVENYDNKTYVNGIELKVPTIGHTEDFKVFLGQNQYFLMGDNREHSMDSRVLGPIDRKAIKCKVIA